MFITDSLEHEVQPVSKPGYLQSFVDPAFGSTITRITGEPGQPIPKIGGDWQDVCRHFYSKDPVWNADQTLLAVKQCFPGDNQGLGPQVLFLDGSSYEVTGLRVPPQLVAMHPCCIEFETRWHPTNAKIMVWAGGNQVGLWNVRTEEVTLLAAIPGYASLRIGPWEGQLSRNGRFVVLQGLDYLGQSVCFAYDLKFQIKYPDIYVNSADLDWASISPTGLTVVVHGRFDGLKLTRFFDPATGEPSAPEWAEPNRPDHYDMTVDGLDEIAVGRSRTAPDNRMLIRRRVSDGAVQVLAGPGYFTHTSLRNLLLPGWAYVTNPALPGGRADPDYLPPFHDEILAVKLDGSGLVRRLAHCRSAFIAGDDDAEVHACPAPDGRRVAFASNWENPTGRPMQLYVADLRGIWEE